MNFLAIDFETANYEPDSACAVGLVRVDAGKIVAKESHLIQPPYDDFFFTYLHGIAWEDVQDSPTFGELWPRIEPLTKDIDCFVAHNARFDKGVLHACCRRAKIRPPKIPFQCTVQLSRSIWGIYPTNLPAVCRHFGIRLNHHDAASDTLACAQIMIRAMQESPT